MAASTGRTASVEPQTGLPHLLRTGTELADQTSETVKAGQTRSAGSAGRTERDLVDGLHGGSPRGAPAEKVWIKTNGQLGGMDVIDAQGRLRCTGPVASNEFRGPDSYLYCP
jgi:hypothetical protein